MKNIITIISVFLFSFVNAQIGGEYSIDLSAGIEQNGLSGRLGFSYYLSDGKFLRLSGQVNKEKFTDEDIPVYQYQATLDYYTSLYTEYNKSWIIFVGGGILGGYEQINNDKKYLPDNREVLAESKFIYGGHIGIEIDKYLFDTGRNMVSLFVNARENYYFQSDLGNLQFNITGGIRYSF